MRAGWRSSSTELHPAPGSPSSWASRSWAEHSASSSAAVAPLGRDETLQDTAGVLSRYVDAIVWRPSAKSGWTPWRQSRRCPVINALSDEFHPCQVADLQTIAERRGAARPEVVLRSATAPATWPTRCCSAGSPRVSTSPSRLPRNPARPPIAGRGRAPRPGWHLGDCDRRRPRGAAGADVLVTGTWTSMGQENDRLDRVNRFGRSAQLATSGG